MSSELPANTGDLVDTVLSLPVSDRVVLANAILASIEDGDEETNQEELDQSWGDEIARRIEDIDSGRVETISSSEMWKRIGGRPDIGN
jgi:putative addiction module component (TIGR02574 family)